MSTTEHGRTRLLHYRTVCLCFCSTWLMQSLSTVSQLTVEELVHLHNPGCIAQLGPILSLCSLSSGDDAKSQFVCWYFADSETQTESAAVPSDGGTSAPLYILSICIRYRQRASTKRHKNRAFYTCSSWEVVTLETPCCTRNAYKISPLHWFGDLTVQMHPPLHSITIQMCTDCCTTEGDCIVLAADAVLRSCCDKRNNIPSLIGYRACSEHFRAWICSERQRLCWDGFIHT